MTAALTSPHKFLILLLLLALLCPAYLPAQAAPAPQADSPAALVKAFGQSLQGSSSGQRQAALAIFQHYKEYKGLVAAGKVDKALARAIDEQLVQMTQETWRTVAVRHGSGLDHIVPVGTLGDRWNNPAYIPGKSDKDFIPRGEKAKEAVADFNRAFQNKFGINPAGVDVNALDPTDPTTWPERYAASTNVEKYNTVGGNKWLATEEALQKPNLWRFDPASGTMREVWYEAAVKTPPAPLTKGDALGWFSDNTHFRSKLAEAGMDPKLLVLKQAKYDLRNVSAFQLAGGKLSEADQALLRATQLLRNGKTDAAIGVMMQVTGQADPDQALASYLRSMNEFNDSMAKTIVSNHLKVMNQSLSSGRLTLQLENELAASLVNLPRAQRTAAVEALVGRLGKAKADEIVKLSSVFERRVAAGLTYFDDVAMRSFGKSYDQLSDAERAVLHGADDAAETFLGKSLRYTGYIFSGYAIYNAYVQGQKQGGFGVGAASAFARATIEALQAGVPIAAVAELVAQLAAGAVQLGANAYKNDVLEELYQQYARTQDLGFLLDIQGVLPYYAGGLRQLAIDLKMENPNLSEAEIRKLLGDYFTRRLEAERAAKEMTARVEKVMSWLDKSGIDLLSTNDIEGLTAEDQAAIATLLEAYERIKAQFERDGIPATEENILGALWHLYHGAGSPASFEKYMSDLYRTFKKRYPPAGQARQSRKAAELKVARNAQVKQAKPAQKTGTLLSLAGSFTEGINRPCDPAPGPASADISAGGTISITVTGSGVPCEWSLWNSGGGVTLSYEPVVGGTYGAAEVIARVGLNCGDHPMAKRAAMGAEAPAPGRLTLTLGAPAGSGPLTGGCYAGSVSGQAVMTEVRAAGAARPGDTLNSGDQVVTADNGSAMLIVPGFVSVGIRNKTTMTYADQAAGKAGAADEGRPTLRLEQGGMRVQTLPGGGAVPVEVAGRTVTPQGTDYQVETLSDGGRVIVWDGSVVVRDGAGRSTTVPAGKMLAWPGDALAEVPGDVKPLLQEVPYSDLPLDDTVPACFGTWPAEFGARAASLDQEGVGVLPEGWIWSDPNQDASLESPERGTLVVTVPDNNDLWDYTATAPLLLRKVSGDFDLQGEVMLDSPGKHYAYTEFALYAPGYALGSFAGQMRPQNPGLDVRILGGGRRTWNGRDTLIALGADDANQPEAPNGPVWLRVSRRGNIWRTYRSLDGKAWVLSGVSEVAAPETLWIGWVFKRMSNDGKPEAPAITTLRSVTLVSAPLNSMRSEGWEAIDERVSVDKAGEVTLGISGDETAREQETAVQWARRIEGDFEAVMRVDIGGWDGPAGEERSLALVAVTARGTDLFYSAYNTLVESDTKTRRVYAGDMEIDGRWYRYRETVTEDKAPTYLRLTRVNGRATSSYLAGCQWQEMKPFDDSFGWPVFIRGTLHTKGAGSTPAAAGASLSLVYLAEGPGTAGAPAWKPQECASKAGTDDESVPEEVVLSTPKPPTPARTPALPTAAPKTKPTATPKPTAAPKAKPTATARPKPAPTAAPTACKVAVAPAIRPQYDRGRYGCPLAAQHNTWAAVQMFERGLMLWRKDVGQVYAFPEGPRWQKWPDTWAEGVAIRDRGQPPAGLRAPVRGFGLIWGKDDALFKNLGWARIDEQGICAVVQEFEKVLVILRSPTDRCNGEPSSGASSWFGSVEAYGNGSWR